MASSEESILDADRLAAFRALQAHDVGFVVVGGVAAILLGAPITSNDLDVVPDPDPANLTRLMEALLDVGAEVRFAGAVRRLPDGEWLRASRFWNLDTRSGKLDILMQVGAGLDYHAIRSDAVEIGLGDLNVWVASLDHLIAMKEEANRPKDLQALPILRWLREQPGGPPRT